jgi:pre-mRNA-processing factor 39
MSNQSHVHARWLYESEIKRPYFHVKPLDDSQIRNWRSYLEFEEEEASKAASSSRRGNDNEAAVGDAEAAAEALAVARVYVLYERCLVPCAMYEEFWIRYARFLGTRGDVERLRNVYMRADSVFLPAR